MRRFSQRSALVTLSEINITPLLDLAFVLLIIFVITTPLLTQSINLKLPQGGTRSPTLSKSDIRTVEIDPKGGYSLEKQRMTLAQMERELIKDHQNNKNLVILIRADAMGRNKDLFAVFDLCQRNGLTRYSLATEPPKPKN
jgi:biopolymer transport protein ExbD